MQQHEDARWGREAKFFDEEARRAAADLVPLDEKVVRRYQGRLHRHIWPEYRFRAVGDLRGERVLDVGCGDGRTSVLLARLGAHVEGVDVAPGAIQVARRRAEVNNLSDRASFRCAPLETVGYPPSSFDVIWCDAVLHHVIDDLEATTRRFREWVRPGGLVVMIEPVNLSRALRWLRFAVAPPSAHTPDERPLEAAELALIRQQLPGTRTRYFRALGRLDGYLLPDRKYEKAVAWRRAAYHAVSAIDYVLLSLPPFTRLASVAILTARVWK